MRKSWWSRGGVLLALAMTVVAPAAHAYSCDMLPSYVADARNNLKRASYEKDLDDAQNYARRAKSDLDDAAMASMDCDCYPAQSDFDSAASRARRAQNADDGEEFADELTRSIREFNSAMSSIQLCAGDPRRRR